MLTQFVQYSFYGIILFWIVTHANQFGTVIGSIQHAVQSGTRSLWGFQ